MEDLIASYYKGHDYPWLICRRGWRQTVMILTVSVEATLACCAKLIWETQSLLCARLIVIIGVSMSGMNVRLLASWLLKQFLEALRMLA